MAERPDERTDAWKEGAITAQQCPVATTMERERADYPREPASERVAKLYLADCYCWRDCAPAETERETLSHVTRHLRLAALDLDYVGLNRRRALQVCAVVVC
jgi:hypothetical protein